MLSLLSLPLLAAAAHASALFPRDYSGFKDPNALGGSMLTVVNNTYPPGLGEPLNVIISTESDPAVLKDSLYDGGFQNYMLSVYLSTQCLGAQFSAVQEANLDGRTNVSEIQTLRYNYGDPYIGSCRETFEGGQHLRYWTQNSTGAIFMAVSVEMELAKGHDIIRNGYNAGRDFLVGNLTNLTEPLNGRNLTNTSTFAGSTRYRNYTYHTDVRYVSGLLQNSSEDINHYITVEDDGLPAIDGLVAVLTVTITDRPEGTMSAAQRTVASAALAAAALAVAVLL
ncbi:hypothetical protein CC85DRAFT_288971 [Cutaneotrichosporon oleaginosum]|uniref:Uncharacterized protein n=1 Tax=Cutaneotrichosporon oleaginosum TaxID=879819 RepID=A0A0J0XD42_9TREE|nr:uncharacterized protein CC85DRAFT_288971 [Cutaneotrichosporon oleaginosum]KLT38996.1 hypothetical protein CC85DRAFT_288971 [Cutaneotrichosporon oleaginosum]TXT08303.1 hypothetical protein COLE_05227 [Cutaneotrichosporon oleaginosum]